MFLKTRHLYSYEYIFIGCFVSFFIYSVAFANEMLPAPLISIKTDKLIEYAIIVEKSSQQMILYSISNDSVEEVKRYPCSTGENLGSKSQAGDRKTPEGIYFFTSIFRKKDLTPIYGTRAFPIDYPNYIDKFAGKNGSAIWVHGTNKSLKPRDTNGCIAMVNEDIDDLEQFITLNRTPIVIEKQLSYIASNDRQTDREALFAFLSRQNAYLQEPNKKQYLDAYSYLSEEYLPLWWSQWEDALSLIKKQYPSFYIAFKNILIIKHDLIYVVLFDQILYPEKNNTDKSFFVGMQKLFLVKYDLTRWKVVGEEYQDSPYIKNDPYPLIIASYKMLNKPITVSSLALRYKQQYIKENSPQSIEADTGLKAESTEKTAKTETTKTDKASLRAEITGFIDSWIHAWSSKQIQKYGQHYAQDFVSDGKNFKQWLKYKDTLNNQYKFIKISRKELDIKETKRYIQVSFYQDYISDKYKASGKKLLILKQEGDQWKIYRETWGKM